MQQKSRFWICASSTQLLFGKHLSMPLCSRILPIFLYHYCGSPLQAFQVYSKEFELALFLSEKAISGPYFLNASAQLIERTGHGSCRHTLPLYQDTWTFLEVYFCRRNRPISLIKKIESITVHLTSANQEVGSLLLHTLRQLFSLSESSQGHLGGEIVIAAQQWGIVWQGKPSGLSPDV